eukprot:gene5578-biopygen11758
MESSPFVCRQKNPALVAAQSPGVGRAGADPSQQRRVRARPRRKVGQLVPRRRGAGPLDKDGARAQRGGAHRAEPQRAQPLDEPVPDVAAQRRADREGEEERVAVLRRRAPRRPRRVPQRLAADAEQHALVPRTPHGRAPAPPAAGPQPPHPPRPALPRRGGRAGVEPRDGGDDVLRGAQRGRGGRPDDAEQHAAGEGRPAPAPRRRDPLHAELHGRAALHPLRGERGAAVVGHAQRPPQRGGGAVPRRAHLPGRVRPRRAVFAQPRRGAGVEPRSVDAGEALAEPAGGEAPGRLLPANSARWR